VKQRVLTSQVDDSTYVHGKTTLGSLCESRTFVLEMVEKDTDGPERRPLERGESVRERPNAAPAERPRRHAAAARAH